MGDVRLESRHLRIVLSGETKGGLRSLAHKAASASIVTATGRQPAAETEAGSGKAGATIAPRSVVVVEQG